MRVDDIWLFRDLDLTVQPGQCAVVVGPNGSGKSTLLRCLYGMGKPTEGTVTVTGKPPDERSVRFRRKVSVLLDDSDFFAELNLELLSGSFGMVGSDVDELLADAGLDGRAEVTAGHFSAGQRRRLLLLGATARPFDVLLLDEPERALDTAGKHWLTSVIARATQARAAIVVATHHPPLLYSAHVVVDLS